nr:AraC family transcriptional regulator [Fimbriimonadaceae bacterium]
TRKKGSHIGSHAHEGASLICLLEGRHQWHADDGMIRWSVQGAWYYRAPMVVHSHDACPSEIRCIGFNFMPQMFGGVLPPESGSVLEGPVWAGLASQVLDELRRPTPGGDLLLSGIFRQLLAGLLNMGEEKPLSHPVLKHATDLLRERFDQPWSLSELADEVGTHRSHLARLFQTHLGVSVGEFLRDRRLEWAYTRLASTDEKIAAIAFEAGFADHAHFCRLFKARYGASPSDQRRTMLNGSR